MLRSFLVAAAAGSAIWALPPPMSGHVEPWDAGGFHYPLALALAGIGCALIVPRPLWALYGGCVLGQLAYLLVVVPFDPLMLVGLGFLALWALVFLGGAVVVGGWLHRRGQRAPPR